MRTFIIIFAASIHLAFSTPAEAEIGPASNGPYVVIDDSGENVGAVLYYDGSAVTVAVSTDARLGFLRLSASGAGEHAGLLDTWSGLGIVEYASTDCTGTPYLRRLPSNPGGPALAIIDGDLYAADPGSPQAGISVESYFFSGSCQPYGTQLEGTVWSLTDTGEDLSAYTPPFTIVPAAASTPALSTWSRWVLALSVVGVFAAYDRLRPLRIGHPSVEVLPGCREPRARISPGDC